MFSKCTCTGDWAKIKICSIINLLFCYSLQALDLFVTSFLSDSDLTSVFLWQPKKEQLIATSCSIAPSNNLSTSAHVFNK